MTIDTYLSHPNSTGAVNGFQQSVAMVVGIDGYGYGIPPLRTAVADASRLADLLETQHGYTVHRLTEDVHQARLRSFFSETLPTLLTAEDRLLLYFAGHGVALDGEDGPAGYLIPQDARPEDPTSFLSMLDVHAALDALPCRHMLAIFDCCFAGAFRWASMRSLRPMPETIHKERYDRFIQHPAWQVITSASYDEEALDILRGDLLGRREEGGGNHSPFAAALFAALEGEGDLIPKGEGDGVITAAELHLYLRNTVELQAEQYRHRQTPGIWPLHKHDKGEYIFLVPGYGELNLPPAPPLNLDNNPYKGLNAYDSSRKDARLFFGREDLESELAARVAVQPLTVVLGASGTGKSSLVKAGVLPRLAGWHQEDAANDDAQLDWPIHHEDWVLLQPLRPTANPLRALEHALQQPLSLPPGGDLADALDTWFAAHVEQKLLLVIDQFEELITLCRSDDERNGFQRLLARLIANHPDHLRVVLTLRSDFEPQFAASPLAGLWTPEVRFVAPPMGQDDLRRAIEGPASERVLYFEPPELVDRLINEVIQTPGALPLLSFTLSELYVRYVESESDNRALTEVHYQALGGVVGSLRTSAEREFNALDPAHQATMQRVMLRMIAIEGGEIARRRVPRSELVYGSDEENARVEEVLRRLVAARLVVTGRDDNGDKFVEPAHDALVRAWDRLLVWKREAEEYLPLQRRVAQAAREWVIVDGKAQASFLWHESAYLSLLQQEVSPQRGDASWITKQWRRVRQYYSPTIVPINDSTWLNILESHFVQESLQRRSLLRRRLAAITMAVIVALSTATAWAVYQQNEALVQRDNAIKSEEKAIQEADAARRALSSQLASQANTAISQNLPQRGLLLAIESNKRYSPALPAAKQSLINTMTAIQGRGLSGPTAAIQGMDLSADEQWLAVGSADSTVYLWNLHEKTPSPITLSGHAGAVVQLAFDNRGRWLASLDSHSNVLLWSIQSLSSPPSSLTGNSTEFAHSLVISSNGRWLALADYEGVLIWDLEELSSSPRKHSANTISDGLFFSIDSLWLLVTTMDGSVEMLNMEHHELVTKLSTSAQRYITAQYSPDGQWFAAIGIAEPPTTSGQGAPVGKFDPFAGLIKNAPKVEEATSSAHVVYLWDLNTPGLRPLELMSVTVEIGSPNVLQFSSDGERLAVSIGSTVAKIWKLTSDAEEIEIPLTQMQVTQLAFVPGAAKLAVSGSTNEIIYWNLMDTPPTSTRLVGHDSSVHQLLIMSQSKILISGSDDSTVRMWDLSEATEEPAVLRRHDGAVHKIEVSSDGKWMASSGVDNTVRLWDLENLVGGHHTLFNKGCKDFLTTCKLLFDPDTNWLVLVFWNDLYLWSLDSLHTEPKHMLIDSAQVLFAADSKMVVRALGGDILLWNLHDLDQNPLIIYDHANSRYSPFSSFLALSPNQEWLASAVDNEVLVWSLKSYDDRPRRWLLDTDVKEIVFSPTDEQLGVVSGDGTTLLSLSTSQSPSIVELPGNELVAYHPHNQIIATANSKGEIWLWSLQADQSWSMQWRTLLSEVRNLQFSSDGNWLILLNREGITLKDLRSDTDEVLHLPINYWGASSPYAFQEDLYATSGQSGINLWRISSGHLSAEHFVFPMPTAEDIAFRMDQQQLLTAHQDGTIRVWDFNIGRLLQKGCYALGRNFTFAESQQLFPGEPLQATCSSFEYPE